MMKSAQAEQPHGPRLAPEAITSRNDNRVRSGSKPRAGSSPRIDAAAEWRHWLTGLTIGLLLFETVTGLTIYLLGFSVFNQFSVLLHTVVGVLMVLPVGVYLVQHWLRRFRGNFNHYQLLGYFAGAALLILIVSGVVLTWQALFGTRISYGWDLVHTVVTFLFIAGLGVHLATLLVRKSNNAEVQAAMRTAQRSCLRGTLGWAVGPMALCVWMAVRHTPPEFQESFPESYSFKYGVDRPFAPSLARKDMSAVEEKLKTRIRAALTPGQHQSFAKKLHVDPSEHVGIVTVAERACTDLNLDQGQRTAITTALSDARAAFHRDGAIPARQLAGSAGCGTSGCHSDILEEWLPSAHRYASMDFVFQKVQENMAQELAPEATRYCAGCHDPIALFSGAKNVGNVTLSVEGADEGISCLVCHSIVQTDVRGNADYTVRPVERYLYEFEDAPPARAVSDFLIRAYPRHHIASYSRPLYKTAEACAACHKQYIDEELNDVGWVQGQNQYDSWRKSRWHAEGDPGKTIGCRECHMPLMDSTDPAAGDAQDGNRHVDDGKHRSHRFLAANQFVPRHHGLPGAEEHCELTVQWLRGEYEIPEIADRWTAGPVIRVSLVVPEEVRPGEPVRIQTVLTNNKAGHDFPTGPLDMIEGWVELVVTDEKGNVVYASGRSDDSGYLVNPQIVYKGEAIDRYGKLIGRHELWNKVGARYNRTLFPGFADMTDFEFECPSMSANPMKQVAMKPEDEKTFHLPERLRGSVLKVKATVWYCKFSAPFLDRLFGEEANLRSEVTDVAHAEAIIPIRRDNKRASHDGGQTSEG